MSAQLIEEFNIWQPDYANATVTVYIGSTSNLALLYTDQALSVPAANPQILQSMTDTQGQSYGKFASPLYTATSYRLHIAETNEETGVKDPDLTTLDNQDASFAKVTAKDSGRTLDLRDAIAFSTYAELWGEIIVGPVGSAATNTATLTTAIGQVSSGGRVILPAGVINLNHIDIPAGVVIEGQGKGTTIIQSIMGDKTCTLVGDGAGLRNLTLDGSVLTSGSMGVYAVNCSYTIMDEVLIKRFSTGILYKGGTGARWRNFDVENCVNNALLHGDKDAANTNLGSSFEVNQWNGGTISLSTTLGLELSYEDAICKNFELVGIIFDSNVGTALSLIGAQFGKIRNCKWVGNTINVDINDDTTILTPSTQTNNQTISLHFEGGVMSTGKFQATGVCQDVMLDTMDLRGVEFAMHTAIENAVVARDCVEDSSVTITGETTKFLRVSTTNNGSATGITTGNVATKAWSIALEPGQVVYIEAKVVGVGRNVAQRGAYHISVGAYRAGSALAYDTQTVNFTVGDILTGASSGATGRIQADADGGATGALTLTNISGAFLDNEIITGTSGGSATVNGVLVPAAAALDTVGVTALRTAYETNANWAATFVANAAEIELRVTGDTAQTVEWTVDANVVGT